MKYLFEDIRVIASINAIGLFYEIRNAYLSEPSLAVTEIVYLLRLGFLDLALARISGIRKDMMYPGVTDDYIHLYCERTAYLIEILMGDFL